MEQQQSANGAELKISGGINIGEAITVNGEGESSTGAIRSTSGNNTLSGLITSRQLPQLFNLMMTL